MDKPKYFKIKYIIFILTTNLAFANIFASIFDLPMPFIGNYDALDSIDGQVYSNHWQFLRKHFSWQDNKNIDFKHKTVKTQLDYLKQHPNYMADVTKRAQPYLYYLSQEIYERKLPAEIALIPVVESAFNPYAYSSAGAAGLWQMMPRTAEHYGIELNWWYDGRLDVISSTKAALDYLEKLYENFNQDWLLAIAAYNSGSGTINKAIKYNKKHNKKTDFWSLRLPRETKRYIPKLLAFIEIINTPKKYNQRLLNLPHEPYFDVIQLDSQIDLSLAAKLSNLDIKKIQALNPGFNRFATAPDGPHRIVLPVEKTIVFTEKLKSIEPERLVNYQKYSIKKGDTLIGISKKFNTQVAIIKQLNNLASNTIRINHQLIVPVKSMYS